MLAEKTYESSDSLKSNRFSEKWKITKPNWETPCHQQQKKKNTYLWLVNKCVMCVLFNFCPVE